MIPKARAQRAHETLTGLSYKVEWHEYPMTANTDVAERLRATVAKELKQDVSSITTEHTLRGDLKLNSLDAIELMFRIEEEFDLSIPDDDMEAAICAPSGGNRQGWSFVVVRDAAKRARLGELYREAWGELMK